MDVNLAEEMQKDAVLKSYLKDKEVANDFYRALCNMRWRKIGNEEPEDRVINRLKGEEDYTWSCTWRSSGAIIAELRNNAYNTNENYMDFYCAGDEGTITDLVKECFSRMGWVPSPWP